MEKYNKILKLYLGEDPFRPQFSKIYKIDEFVYTTDSENICKIPIEFTTINEFSEFKDDAKNMVISLFNFKKDKNEIISIDKLKTALNKCYIDEYEEETNEIVCKECDGSGVVTWEYGIYEDEFDCPVCEGEGVIENKTKVKTNEKELGNKYYINIAGKKIKAIYVDRLITVANILGKDMINININNNINNIMADLDKVNIVIMTKTELLPDETSINI